MVNSITISLLYSRITQFPRFPARISDCNDYRFFILFFCLLGRGSSIAFDPILCSAVGFLPLGDSDHIAVSISIDCPATISEKNVAIPAFLSILRFSRKKRHLQHALLCVRNI